jgi:hypothetical protein
MPDTSTVCLRSLDKELVAKKCHEFETDLGDIALRQPRTRRSHKINM